MKPSKKRMLIEKKKQARDTANKTNSAAILMICIIVKNGKELTSKILLRTPRWTWQMF